MRRSSNFSLLIFSASCLAACGAAMAQSGDANLVGTPMVSRAASDAGVTPPIGPPEDPFGDQVQRGTVIGGLRLTPALSMTALRETNPLMTSPKGPSDSGAAADLALRITPVQPNGASAFFALGKTQLASLDSETDSRFVSQVQAMVPVAGWTLPLNFIYSLNNLARSSLVSQDASSATPLVNRQVAKLTIGSVDAIRTFGVSTLTLGVRLTDTEIEDARNTSGQVIKSTASNLAQVWSAKLARPLTSQSQWFVRGGYERYHYDAGNQPVIGTRSSKSPLVAMGLQGMHGKFQGMAEIGHQSKQANSSVVPDSESTIGALMAGYAVSPALRLNAHVNRSVIETNLPGVSNILASSTGVGLGWRFSPKWIAQIDSSLTTLSPNPLSGELNDRVGNLTLLWKPQPSVLLALTTANTRRSVSRELSGLVSAYSDTKTTLNLTYYP